MRAALKLAVFGASGATGRVFVTHALDRGHDVRAQCRPGTPWAAPEGVEVLRGPLDDPTVTRAVVAGADAVLCLFGPRPPHREVFCAAATQVVVDAMKRKEVRRLLCLTGAMVGQGPDLAHLTPPARALAAAFRRSRPAVAEDRVGQEAVVRGSGLAWTLVKPPRLTDQPAVREVEAGPAVRVGLLSSIPRATLAEFLLRTVESNLHLCEAVQLREVPHSR